MKVTEANIKDVYMVLTESAPVLIDRDIADAVTGIYGMSVETLDNLAYYYHGEDAQALIDEYYDE